MNKDIEFTIYGAMKCGGYEAEIRTYKMLKGKSGKRWLIAIQPNFADNIYVEGGVNSDGFGGKILNFQLDTGEVVNLKAPWHANRDSLFVDTGYDVRDKCLTQGICALDVERKYLKPDLYKNVLHYDKEAIIGKYDRIKYTAQNLANKINKKVYYAVRTSGGGNAFYAEPKKEIKNE